MPRTPAAEFPGFEKDLLVFLRQLKRHNERAWFEAHRPQYEALALGPAKAFAEAMVVALARVGPDVRSEPRVNGSIMRINRDTRFSKDKTPYKTALHFIFASGEGALKTNPAFYLRIAPEGLGVGAGLIGFDPGQLARFREAVLDQKQGPALRSALDKVRKAGPYEVSEPSLKRVPRGFDAEHRNADFLRHKGFFVGGDRPYPDALFGAKAVPWIIDRFRELRPVQAWLVRALEA